MNVVKRKKSAPYEGSRSRKAISRTAAAAAAASSSDHANDDVASAASSDESAELQRAISHSKSKSVVLDGANLAWTFSAALFSKLGCRTRLPLSRGVTLALECDTWTKQKVEPIAFMPESYVEGPLHGLADGGTLDTLIPANVVYLGNSRWRNVVLWNLRQAGRLVLVKRPKGARDSDDKAVISYARERDAMICSNDRYEDHIAGAGSGDASKELRRWLAVKRTGYEFCVGTPEDAAYAQGKPSVMKPPVGCSHLGPPPPEEEELVVPGTLSVNSLEEEEEMKGMDEGDDAKDEDEGEGGGTMKATEWRADVHAVGSSRPWALSVNSRWGKDKRRKGKRRRNSLGYKGSSSRKAAKRRASSSDSELDDPEFPFWALPNEDLPVTFKLKKAIK